MTYQDTFLKELREDYGFAIDLMDNKIDDALRIVYSVTQVECSKYIYSFRMLAARGKDQQRRIRLLFIS